MLSENALAIYKRLYFDEKQNETTPEQVHKRVADFIANDVVEADKFLEMMNENIFRPNTPCLINAGRKSKNLHDKQLCACFVLGLEDSMDSIIDMWGDCALIYASGAGAGIPITNLREAKSPISTGGTASGPLRYLKVVDLLSDTVRSGGKTRRAANIGVFKYNHPDTMNIINCKKDVIDGGLTSFNLSIALDDPFMDCIMGDDLDATFTVTSPNKNEPVRIEKIRNIWDAVIENAWTSGDPGILFIDVVNDFNPFPSIGKIEATNPCVRGNTLILTNEGYIPIQERVNKITRVWNGEKFSAVIPQVTGQKQPMLTIVFSDGNELCVTKKHKFYINNAGLGIEAESLMVGDKLQKWDFPIIDIPVKFKWEHDAYTHGFYSGDGYWNTDKGKPCITLYGEKLKLKQYLHYTNEHKPDESRNRQSIFLSRKMPPKFNVPLNPVEYPLSYRLNWLAGLCDSDGTITHDGNIQITNINFEFLQKVKLMINTLGINGTLNISHLEQIKEMPNGDDVKEYTCQNCYRLCIPAWQIKQIMLLGFQTHRLDLTKVNPNRDCSPFIKVVQIDDYSEIDDKVYCFTEEDRHRGCFNGIVTGQCGETPQLPWVVCNLGSININCFVKDGSFDWDNFKYYVRLATRFLDRVIDKTTYLNERFEKHTKQIRPIGLGIMGFADALMTLELPYGSPDSIEFFKIICSTLTLIAIDESINMAQEYGSLTIPPEDYNHFEKLINYYTNDDHTIREKFKKFGIRNATWTCIAPTGSISLSADCSYAWEPHFALAWKKPLVDTDQVLTMVLPEFKRQLSKIAFESNMTSKRLMEKVIANNGSLKGIEGVPPHYMDKYRVAHDIDPIEKIKMQGAGQHYISLAISATSNLPNSATKEDIANIFKAAYQYGLKGVTVFRDGCKDSVVQMGNKKEEPTNIVATETLMMQRPIKRAGETVEINTPYGKLFITCNFNNNSKPFEIFFRVGKQGALTNVLIDALGRVCSKALQSGMHMDHIVETLRGLKGDKFWFKIADDVDRSVEAESIVDAIASIIECHWNKNNIVPMNECIETYGEECPQCFRRTLRKDTGCRGGACMACGYSSCG